MLARLALLVALAALLPPAAAAQVSIPLPGAGDEPPGQDPGPPPPDPPPEPPPPPSAISIAVEPPAALFGERVRVTGRLAGGPHHQPGLELEAAPWPFRRYRVVARFRAEPDESYAIEAAPRLNTRYRVRLQSDPSVRTEAPLVLVHPIYEVDYRFFPRRPSVRLLYRVSGGFSRGDPRPRGGRRVFFYLRLRGERRYRRVASAPLRDYHHRNSARMYLTSVDLRLTPTIRRATRVYACTRRPPVSGMGHRWRFDACGRRRLAPPR